MAELSYISVSPHLFGHGLARELLTEIRSVLTARGYDRAELSVYTDNHRAIRVYEHLGWRPFGDPTPTCGPASPSSGTHWNSQARRPKTDQLG